jgi:2-deoxy-D-gluconate 3-dehydrogenase
MTPVLDLFRLDGRTAVVTGARRGMGAAMALALAQAGADIVGVSATLTDEDQIAQNVRALGRKFFAHSVDLSDRAALQQFVSTVRAQHSFVDILVNNAGSILRQPAVEHSDDYWDRILAINQTAPFLLAREFGRAMIARGSGNIIFIGSLLSFQGGITVPGYAASKGAVAQLTKALANEWASLGVNVNAIAPGYIATDNTAALRADPVRSSQILGRIPANRWGEAADLMGAIVFLASPASRYVHGTVLTVDGGWMGR